MKTRILNYSHIGKDPDIKQLFVDKTHNKLLLKGRPGQGGTSVILSDKNWIVVSPTTGMISGKYNHYKLNEQEYLQNVKHNRDTDKLTKCFFICSDTPDTWLDYYNYKGDKNLNTTPDQIIICEKSYPIIFKELIETSIFVDEIDQYVIDGSYRDKMKPFLNLLFYTWKAKWSVSSATIDIVNNKVINIPPDVEYEFYYIKDADTKIKNIEVRINNESDVELMSVIKQSLYNNRKILIATNKTKTHKTLAKLQSFENYKVINLVGDNMNAKLSTIKDADGNVDPEKADIILISSKYYAGFDIELDMDVIIQTDVWFEYNSIRSNDISQIIGRARRGTGRLVLFIDNRISGNPDKNYRSTLLLDPKEKNLEKEFINKLYEKVDNINSDNWIEEGLNVIQNWRFKCLSKINFLKEELKRYNLNVVSYEYIKRDLIDLMPELKIASWPFNKQLDQLLTYDLEKLKLTYGTIKKFLKNKDEGIFTPDLAQIYLVAILIKEGKVKPPRSTKNITPKRLYNIINNTISNNQDWNALWTYYKCKSIKNFDKNSQAIKWLYIYSQPSEDILIKYKDLEDVKRNAELNVINEFGSITDDEREELYRYCKRYYDNYKISQNYFNNMNYLLDIVGNAALYVMNGGREYFYYSLKDFREYNPLTAVPRYLRSLIEVDLIEIDIQHANPTFIDAVVGSNLAGVVYQIIMKKYNISRSKSKVKYNMFLNNHKSNYIKSYKFFTGIGYTHEQTTQILDMTFEKTTFFEMTKIENLIINHVIKRYLPENTQTFRFHDAIVMYYKDIRKLSELPDKFDMPEIGLYDIKLNVKSFNTQQKIDEKLWKGEYYNNYIF